MDTIGNAREEHSSESEYSESYDGDSNSESAAATTSSEDDEEDDEGDGDGDGEDDGDGDEDGEGDGDSHSENQVELAQITKGTVLQLPRGLCNNMDVFKEFFSMETWRLLPSNYQAYLKNKFLPHFDENNDQEQERTLEMLFGNELKRFHTSPLIDLQRNLEEGNYRPEVLKLRENLEKSKRKERRFQECERIINLAKNMYASREKLLRTAYETTSGNRFRVEKVLRKTPQLNKAMYAMRARKRFHSEIRQLKNQLGITDFSEEEIEDDDVAVLSKDVDADANAKIELDHAKEMKILGTLHRYKKINRCSIGTEPLCDANFKKVIMEHKYRKLEQPDRPEFETTDIRLRDIYTRTQMAGSYKRMYPSGKTPGRKPKTKNLQEKVVEEARMAALQAKEDLKSQLSPSLLTHQLPGLQGLSEKPFEPPMTNLPMTVHGNIISVDSDDEVNVDTIDTSTICRLPTINGNDFRHSEEIVIPMSEIRVDPPDPSLPSPQKLVPYHGKIKIATFSDLKNVDVLNIPLEMDDSCLSETDFNSHHGHTVLSQSMSLPSIKALGSTVGGELIQGTHACFLSLIRDIFCATQNHRMKLDELRDKIHYWVSTPIAALNDWFCLVDNWPSLITSAINFLAGDFSAQPEEYVPYIEYKPQINIYQWIGASRDSDARLKHLCNYWMVRKHEMTHKTAHKPEMSTRKMIAFEENGSTERLASPPPPRCPTTWSVQPATIEEISEFQRQERERFENPHRSYTYRMHGYESVVGPVKGIYTQTYALTKARGHSMMIGDRPSYVTILTLVRDATARLPNGEGTRADISELLKYSQYINRDAPENVLQTIVSGALDRMHTEHDPCVRYDTKRKTWIYLHRNRTEEEFERMHQQYQGLGKHKKATNRKVRAKIILKETPTTTMGTSTSLPAVMPTNPVIVNPSASQVSANTHHSRKSLIKPELISGDKIEVMETTEVISMDARQSPSTSSHLHPPQTQFVPQKLFTTTQTAQKKSNTTPIIVATPSGIQTVHVSTASTPTMITIPTSSATPSPEKKPGQPLNSPTIVFSPGQQIITTNQQSPQQISVANKKIPINKPIIINQPVGTGQQQLQSQQSSQQQGFIIPININNSEQFKVMGNSLVLSEQQKAKINPTSVASFVQQPANKNIVRIAGGKSLLSPQLAKVQNQPGQRVSTFTTGGTIRPQLQKTISGISLINAPTAGVKTSPQPLTNLQQKQIIQGFLNQQGGKQRLVIGNLGSLLPQQQQQLVQGKNVIIQQSPQQQKLITATTTPVVSSTVTNSASGTIISTSSTAGGTIIGSPIFQIHPSPNTSGTPTKFQTLNANSLTPQQQQGLLQNLKQPQFKTVPVSQLVPGQQQSLIIKQQPIFTQQQSAQQQQNPVSPAKILTTSQQTSTGTMTPVNVGAHGPKTVVVSGVGNVIATATSSGNIIKHPTIQLQSGVRKPITVVSQPQNITRVIKSTGTQNQIVSRTGIRTQSLNPVMAKVLTSSSGQIISLDSLLQKQGATLRVSNTKPNQPANVIQLSGAPNSQITQYTVVSQGRNLIPVSGQQQQARLISTQASTNTVSTTPSSASKVAANTTTAKLIPTNSITAHQLVNAKFLNKAGGIATTSGGAIRMINAQNFNIANIQGKSVLIASKQGTNINQGQIGQQASATTGASVVIGGQTLKLQGNVIPTSNMQLINKSVSSAVGSSTTSATTSTVMIGNPILKVQQQTPIKQGSATATSTPLTTIASTNTGTVVVNSNSILNHQNMTKAVVLGSTGQTIRLQTPSQAQSSAGNTIKTISGTTIAQGTTMKSTGNRVVLAVQGGGQIFLSPNIQGGSINLKSLQGMKVVSLTQQPQMQQQQKQQQQTSTQPPAQQSPQQQHAKTPQK